MCKNLDSLHPRTLCAKISWNWASDFGGEYKNVKRKQTDAGHQAIRKAHLSFKKTQFFLLKCQEIYVSISDRVCCIIHSSQRHTTFCILRQNNAIPLFTFSLAHGKIIPSVKTPRSGPPITPNRASAAWKGIRRTTHHSNFIKDIHIHIYL